MKISSLPVTSVSVAAVLLRPTRSRWVRRSSWLIPLASSRSFALRGADKAAKTRKTTDSDLFSLSKNCFLHLVDPSVSSPPSSPFFCRCTNLLKNSSQVAYCHAAFPVGCSCKPKFRSCSATLRGCLRGADILVCPLGRLSSHPEVGLESPADRQAVKPAPLGFAVGPRLLNFGMQSKSDRTGSCPLGPDRVSTGCNVFNWHS